jgi:uncharacterized protein with FMN-binding domain
MNSDQPNNTKKIVTTLAVLIVIVAIVAATKAAKNNNATADTSAAQSSSQQASDTNTTTTDTTSSNQTYKDGTYEATGQYDSPGGLESISVSVTIKANAISDTSATTKASGKDAQQFQDEFIQAYKSQVVGKNINSVHLSTVSGSSLTSQGFNEALTQIKNEAKS